jgi:hypothetical protein
MFPDLPGNSLKPNQLSDTTNCTAYDQILVPRTGQVQSFGLPTGYDSTSFPVDHIGPLAGVTGYTATASDVGKFLVYASGERTDLILAKGLGNTYTVYDDGLTWSDTAVVRDRVWGWYYHKKRSLYVLHIGTDLWVYNGSWVQVHQSGATALPRSWSKMEEFSDKLLIWNQGLYKVDFDRMVYWKTNVEPGLNTLSNPTGYGAGYLRRYGWTMTRQGGNTYPLLSDQTSNTLFQESGFNALDANNIDYREVFSGSKKCGPDNVEYQELQTAQVFTTAGLDGTAMHMGITCNGAVHDIQWSAQPGVSTLNDIAAYVQNSGRAAFGTDFFCRYDSNQAVYQLGLNQPQSTADYQSTPPAVTGYQDATNFKGKLEDGATIVSDYYYTSNNLTPFSVPSDWKAFTHFTFYQTDNLVREGTLTTGSPDSFAWMGDVPIMQAIDATVCGDTIVAKTGKWLPLTLNDSFAVADQTASTNGLAQDALFYIYNDTSASGGFLPFFPVHKPAWVFIGCKTGLVMDCTAGHVSAYKWLNVWNDTNQYKSNLTDATVALAVGDPLFCSDGAVRYVSSVVTYNNFWLDDTGYSCSKQPCCVEPKTTTGVHWLNLVTDSADDNTVSARVGTLGLRTRFYTAIPAVTTGCVAPGYVVSGLNTRFYWNDVGVDKQYIIGNCHPTYQQQEISGLITAISLNSNMVSVFTANSTYTTQTNLQLSYTDTANGNVISILPTALLTDMYNGVKSDRYMYQFERDMHIAVNQDSGIRTWNGVQWSDSVVFKKIQNRIRALADLVVTYDQEYGVVVMGYETGNVPNRMYVVGIRSDKFVGAAQFTLAAYPDPGIQPIDVGTRAVYMSLGNVASDDGSLRLLTDLLTQFQLGRSTDGTSEIPWSFQTGDDVAPMQRNTLRHLEGNLYVSGIPPTDEVARATTINITAYNDVNSQVTVNRSLPAHPHYYGSIAYDTRIVGHRIRYRVSCDKATMVVNGMDVTYVSYDKAQSIVNRTTNEGTWQAELNSPALWVTRTPFLTNLATGRGCTMHGTVTRGVGPDGRAYSSMGT